MKNVTDNNEKMRKPRWTWCQSRTRDWASYRLRCYSARSVHLYSVLNNI